MKLVEQLEHIIGLLEKPATVPEIKSALLAAHQEAEGHDHSAEEHVKEVAGLHAQIAKLEAEKAKLEAENAQLQPPPDWLEQEVKKEREFRRKNELNYDVGCV